MAVDPTEIERRIDRAVADPIPIDAKVGALVLQTMGEVMEFAKMMAVSGAAVPKYLRGNPGACLAICSRALRWGMDPFAVAEKSYMVINRGEERIAYEAQLVHAVITAHAPLTGRLRSTIMGEGDERRCKVWGTFKGETKPHEYLSESLGKLRDARGRNEAGRVKGSQLWDEQPEVQLTYSAVRQWCRSHSPETLLGVYAVDEFTDAEPVDITPSLTDLSERLKSAKRQAGQRKGFDEARVRRIIEGEPKEASDADTGERDVEAGRERAGGGETDHNGDPPDQDRGPSTRASPQASERGASGQTAKGPQGKGGGAGPGTRRDAKAAPHKGKR